MTAPPPAGLPRLGVLHAPFGAAGLRDIYAAARGLCEVVLMFRPAVAAAHPDIVAAARSLFQVVILEDDGGSGWPGLDLAGVTTFHDSELDVVDQALHRLGLVGTTGVAGPWDKLVQRRRFAAAGISSLRAEAVDSPETFRDAVRRVGLPGVLKPRRAARGAGIAFVSEPADVAYQVAARTGWQGLLFESLIPPGDHPSGVAWLADFVSVETVSRGSEHLHVAVFDKTPMSVVARAGEDGADSVNTTGDVTPSRLPDDVRAEVLRCVSAALDALGVSWRVTHTELRVTADGVEVIEVNGRPGGHMSPILRLLDGPDLIRSAVCVALGRDPEVGTGARAGYAAGLFMTFPDRRGRVVSDVQGASLRALPGVVGVDEVASRGDWRADTGFRVATVTLRAADAAALDRDARLVMRGIAALFRADGLLQDPWLSQVQADISRVDPTFDPEEGVVR